MPQEKIFYDIYKSPFCDIILVGTEKGLRNLHLKTSKVKKKFEIKKGWTKSSKHFKQVKSQLDEYFQGKRKKFDIKLDLQGTQFQLKVWKALRQIPFGKIKSYKDIAKKVGNEKASRAVGGANNKNPIPLIIPCHRVIGSNGGMVGFAPGISLKEKLLEHETKN